MRRVVTPALALVVLAVALVLLGLAITGRADAATTPSPSLTSPSRVEPAVVQFGQDVTVPAGRRVESVVAGGGNVVINGSVKSTVVVFGGNLLVRGSIGQGIVGFGTHVRLAPSAVVHGFRNQRQAVVLFGGTITKDPGAQVSGEVRHITSANWGGSLGWATRHTLITPWWGFTLIGWVVQTAIFLVLALVAAALLPTQMRAVQRHLVRKPWPSLGWGALTLFIIFPAVFIVLGISIVGILLWLPYLVVVPLFCFFAITAVAALIAERVLAGTAQKDNLMLAVTLGVVGTTIVSRVPVGGVLALLAMAMLGTGGAAMAIAQWRRDRRLAAQQTAAPALAQPAAAWPPPPYVAAPAEGPAARDEQSPAPAVGTGEPPVADQPSVDAPPPVAAPPSVAAPPLPDVPPVEGAPPGEAPSAS